MGRSQETFFKKEREKKRLKKKKEKQEKRAAKEKGDKSGIPDIDWSSAPENKTMSEQQKNEKAQNRRNTIK